MPDERDKVESNSRIARPGTDSKMSGTTEKFLTAAERRDERFERIMMTHADRISSLEKSTAEESAQIRLSLNSLALETKAGFNSLVVSNQEMRAESAEFATQDRDRAATSQGLQRQTNETLTDIKVYMGTQTDLAQRADKRAEETHQDRRSKLNELWKQAVLPLVIAIVGFLLYFLK